jgi:DNA helicase-2/ATP-dependent DNA helicase PcrA
MADFERDYGVRRLIKLEQNYRSSGHILDAANHLIATTAAPGQEPAHRRRRRRADPRDRGAQRLRRGAVVARGGPGPAPCGTARAADRRALPQQRAEPGHREALFNAGLPYRVYGGLRFFERAEVKHALAYLRLLENPNDDTSFLRVVNFPARGIGARSVEQLQDAARASGRSLWQSRGRR